MNNLTPLPIPIWSEPEPTHQPTILQAPKSCDGKLDADSKVICQSYTSWANYLADFENALKLVRLGCDSIFKDDKMLRDKMNHALHALFNLSTSAHKAFLDGIQALNDKKAVEPVHPPADIPAWPDDDPKSPNHAQDLVESIWNIISSALTKLLKEMEAKGNPGPIYIALNGLSVDGEKAVEEIVKIFSDAE